MRVVHAFGDLQTSICWYRLVGRGLANVFASVGALRGTRCKASPDKQQRQKGANVVECNKANRNSISELEGRRVTVVRVWDLKYFDGLFSGVTSAKAGAS